jgi:hypothetical protein
MTTTETNLGRHGDEPVGRDVRQEALIPAVDRVAAVQEDGHGVDAGVGGGDHHERLGHAGDLAVVDVPRLPLLQVSSIQAVRLASTQAVPGTACGAPPVM